MHCWIVLTSEHFPPFIKSASHYELMLSRDHGMLKTENPQCKHKKLINSSILLMMMIFPEKDFESTSTNVTCIFKNCTPWRSDLAWLEIPHQPDCSVDFWWHSWRKARCCWSLSGGRAQYWPICLHLLLTSGARHDTLLRRDYTSMTEFDVQRAPKRAVWGHKETFSSEYIQTYPNSQPQI